MKKVTSLYVSIVPRQCGPKVHVLPGDLVGDASRGSSVIPSKRIAVLRVTLKEEY